MRRTAAKNAISELTTLRERLANDSAAQKDVFARIDAIIESLARSTAASRIAGPPSLNARPAHEE